MSLVALIFLFVLTKLMGRRQIGQLSFYDYITGITLGSIAAELAISKTDRIIACLVGMVIFALAGILFAQLTDKSLFFRKVITGEPYVLYKDGSLNVKNLSRAMLDVNEFLSAARVKGYFDLSELDTALLEPNGEISFRPTPQTRPPTCGDLNLSPPPNPEIIPVILNGKILAERLRQIGRDETWLRCRLRECGDVPVEETILATCDQYYNIISYKG